MADRVFRAVDDLALRVRRVAADFAARFFAGVAGFFFPEEARAFLTIAAPIALVTAAPTTAATTPAVRERLRLRSALAAAAEGVERDDDEDEEEALVFMG